MLEAESESEDQILASKAAWPRGLNITGACVSRDDILSTFMSLSDRYLELKELVCK